MPILIGPVYLINKTARFMEKIRINASRNETKKVLEKPVASTQVIKSNAKHLSDVDDLLAEIGLCMYCIYLLQTYVLSDQPIQSYYSHQTTLNCTLFWQLLETDPLLFDKMSRTLT